MYWNVFGKKVSQARFKQLITARKHRPELIAAGFGRRELFKLGLLTASGYLVSKSGLSARVGAPIPVAQAASPRVQPFVEPLPIMPIKQPVRSLRPAPTVDPNTAAGEVRTRPHQALTLFPPQRLYSVRQEEARMRMSPQLPEQVLWGFDGVVPGPTYVAR